MARFGENYGENYDLTTEIVISAGVTLEGSHAQELIGNPAPVDLRGLFEPKIKPKTKTHTFSALGKVSRLAILSANARIEKTIRSSAVSKLTRLVESKATGKITRLRLLEMDASIYTKNEPFFKRHQNPRNIEDAFKENRKRQIKSLYERYKDVI